MYARSITIFSFWECPTEHILSVIVSSFLLLTGIASPSFALERQKIFSAGRVRYSNNVGGNVRFFSALEADDPYFWSNIDALGFNTIRLFIGNASISPAQIKEFLDTAEQYGIRTIVLLPKYLEALDPEGKRDLNKTKQNIYDFIVGGGLKGDSRILAWDIANEPDLGDAQTLDALHEMSEYIKSVAPNTAITIGGWHNSNRSHFPWQHPEDGDLIVDFVDIYSPHIYLEASHFRSVFTPETPDEEIWQTIYAWWKNRVQHHLNHSMGKPVIVEEFGVDFEWLRQMVGEDRAESVEAIFFNATTKAMSETSVKGMLFWNYFIGDKWCPIELDNHWRQAAYVIKGYFTKLA